MKHFLCLAGFLTGMMPAMSQAQVQTYYHAGAWDAFSGRTESGAVCGVGTTMPPDSRRLSMRFDIGGTLTRFVASKPDWSIPGNARVTVVVQIGLNAPLTVQATGQSHPSDQGHGPGPGQDSGAAGNQRDGNDAAADVGHELTWTLDPDTIQAFDRQFRSAPSMTLAFPDGNERPWTVSLAGSTAISDTFGRCVRDLTRQVQSFHPTQGNNPPPQGATQPFSQPNAPPPPQ